MIIQGKFDPLNFWVLVLCAFLSGCSVSSSGVGLGVKGSTLWHNTTPESDIQAFYSSKSEAFLKTKWDESYDSPTVREAIGAELIRRSMDPLKYLDESADAARRQDDEREREEREKRRRAKERDKAKAKAIDKLIDKF